MTSFGAVTVVETLASRGWSIINRRPAGLSSDFSCTLDWRNNILSTSPAKERGPQPPTEVVEMSDE